MGPMVSPITSLTADEDAAALRRHDLDLGEVGVGRSPVHQAGPVRLRGGVTGDHDADRSATGAGAPAPVRWRAPTTVGPAQRCRGPMTRRPKRRSGLRRGRRGRGRRGRRRDRRRRRGRRRGRGREQADQRCLTRPRSQPPGRCRHPDSSTRRCRSGRSPRRPRSRTVVDSAAVVNVRPSPRRRWLPDRLLDPLVRHDRHAERQDDPHHEQQRAGPVEPVRVDEHEDRPVEQVQPYETFPSHTTPSISRTLRTAPGACRPSTQSGRTRRRPAATRRGTPGRSTTGTARRTQRAPRRATGASGATPSGARRPDSTTARNAPIEDLADAGGRRPVGGVGAPHLCDHGRRQRT